MRLSLATVQSLKNAATKSTTGSRKAVMEFPSYNPKELKPGILHVGVGNFHRSHMAAYMNDLFNTSSSNKNHSWGIIGTGVMPQEHDKRNMLEQQDWLQTLVELDGNKGTTKASILASMIDFTPVDYNNERGHIDFYNQLLNNDIKIVSLTVTEGGYFMDNDGNLDLSNVKIQHDIANPTMPCTVFGLVCKALMQRKAEGRPPFTVLSCDNIPHNGRVTQNIVSELSYQMFGSELQEWIVTHGAFPNSMVDRITPAASKEISEMIEEMFGYQDTAPVLCEPFRQWVLEDKFVNGERPDWDRLETVSVVDDVAPYENMKIRILNGGHASLCYPAALLGLKFVHEAITHPTIGPFMNTLERKEIIPTLPPVPNTNLIEYWNIIASRFANPTLQDTITRICFDGFNRQPKFIVPVAKDALMNAKLSGDTDAGVVDGVALVSAMWCRYCQGTTEAGQAIGPNDPEWETLARAANKAKMEPTAWLDALPQVYGSVGHDPVFRAAFVNASNAIQRKGVEQAMQDFTEANVSKT
ncbi:multiple polyol-specific dehydrogenase [Nitzschia inconspicua]|uniref:Multiple polyol-specific dehydrogenase n=1 Tax=Nitzschia inconspicua TaxID=303405 RepID=A0A9K3KVR1_9STRA|nr:multiple polyol-specific dehydrogenase [Nitzschia inconspicua]KAG7350085.1 multiple polyol-specific dehydrogenase [Nitzschia inconspicua]